MKKQRDKFTKPLGQAIATCKNHLENIFTHVLQMAPSATESEIDMANRVTEELLSSVNQKYGIRLTYMIFALGHKTCMSQALTVMESTRDRENAKRAVEKIKAGHSAGEVSKADTRESPESGSAEGCQFDGGGE